MSVNKVNLLSLLQDFSESLKVPWQRTLHSQVNLALNPPFPSPSLPMEHIAYRPLSEMRGPSVHFEDGRGLD